MTCFAPNTDWEALGVSSYYAEYFKGIPRLGIMQTNSEDYGYFLVPSNQGKIAILSAGYFHELSNPERKGGEGRCSAFYYASQSEHDHNGKPVDLVVNSKKTIARLEPFKYLVMVTGCDDGHLAFYFRNKEEAMDLLDACEFIDDLVYVSSRFSDDVIDALCVSDVRN